ncbi:MAG: HupE/UreJ family protein [Rhizobiaceae bacterium]
MDNSGNMWGKLVLVRLVSSITCLWLLFMAAANAHEVFPSIADVEQKNGVLQVDIRLSIESVVADVDLSKVSDTNESPNAAVYDELRALEPAALEQRFRDIWPEMAQQITIVTELGRAELALKSVEISEVGNIELVRSSRLRFDAELPANSQNVQIGWSAKYGALVVRQVGVENPYDGYLENGQLSDPIKLSGGSGKGALATFLRYTAVGFDHILPKGLDHVLFVLGLFFLSARLRPLVWQVTAFTAAHTVTLALSTLGYVSVSPAIVEPIIALSIVYVAIENVISDRLMTWRPLVIFLFGLLHGLGFAGVLGEFGLPETAYLSALIGFNVGVELGQLTVIAIAFALVGYWFGRKSWYRARISIPGSLLIALVGGYWFLERTVL